ncbi:hypothetical protein DNTS_029677 [Danionella cerebrum]|uniref:Uncharacterized protein n=1 Tax=Danionella cerebrum TaxID=2873325 RepID=A0A553QFN1_9TELE|nr:hypothetical protein DNTS_029677 [Danionella translucida]
MLSIPTEEENKCMLLPPSLHLEGDELLSESPPTEELAVLRVLLKFTLLSSSPKLRLLGGLHCDVSSLSRVPLELCGVLLSQVCERESSSVCLVVFLAHVER